MAGAAYGLPMFGSPKLKACRIGLSATGPSFTTTPTQIPWDTNLDGLGQYVDKAAKGFRAPTTGLWLLSYYVLMTSGNFGGNSTSFDIRVNGTVLPKCATIQVNDGNTSTNTRNFGFYTIPIFLAKGDLVTNFAVHGGGNGTTVSSDSHFAATLIVEGS